MQYIYEILGISEILSSISEILSRIAESHTLLLVISTIFAAIPAAIWLYVFLKDDSNSKKTVGIVFLLGCLTAPILLGIQYLWEEAPQFNLASLIEENIHTQSIMFIFMFVLFGAMEEIIKLYVVRAVDKTTTLIKKINDAIRFALVAALGFSFTENIYYLYEFWPSINGGELMGMYIFRSIFTACAHMIFSGVFGYYYGIGKFSVVIAQAKQLTEGTDWATKAISKIFRLPVAEGFRQKMIVKGLFIAIFMHATFNFLLQFNIILPVIGFVIVGFIFLKFLLSRKAGHLILAIDPSTRRPATIAQKNADVVVELLGMWTNDKRYVDVIHVCERLLERDPDNAVVKLFKAKAMDEMDDSDPYKKILNTVVKTNDDLTARQKSIISKYTEEKEMFSKVRQMVAEQLEKRKKESTELKKAQERVKELLAKQGKQIQKPILY